MRIGMRAELVIPEEQCRMKREAKLRQRSNTRDGCELPSPSSSDLPSHILGDATAMEPELSPETSELISRIRSASQQAALLRDEAIASLSASKTEILMLRTARKYDATERCLYLGVDRYSFRYVTKLS
ncbi:hypothetical protein OESDEN_12194 [Oesophagostomum dentatum]|uniref:Uncharacterized protein n=1 Tax=Oesophagostomum dentatum TaxID=61180 RepID=A0A0B1SVU2_OESDE|nr:hypothetical protein OESDEN_12194 [Oesophagostomum dentatum]